MKSPAAELEARAAVPEAALAQVELDICEPPEKGREDEGGLALTLTHVRSTALLDAASASSRCDLWAKTWSTSLLLARTLRARAVRAHLGGLRTLEVGAGALGLPSLLAASAGATAMCTDGIAEAVDLLALNATRNKLAGSFEAARLSWFDDSATSRAAEAHCDLLLGSDVLFATANAKPLAALVSAALAHAEHGVLLLTDPARPSAEGFAEALEASGLTVAVDSVNRAAVFEGVLRQADLFVACRDPRLLSNTPIPDQPSHESARQLVVAVRGAWAALPTKGGGGGMGEKFAYVVDLQQSEAPTPVVGASPSVPLVSFIESPFSSRTEYKAYVKLPESERVAALAAYTEKLAAGAAAGAAAVASTGAAAATSTGAAATFHARVSLVSNQRVGQETYVDVTLTLKRDGSAIHDTSEYGFGGGMATQLIGKYTVEDTGVLIMYSKEARFIGGGQKIDSEGHPIPDEQRDIGAKTSRYTWAQLFMKGPPS